MPRAPKPQADVDEIRERIAHEAAVIISREGFPGLTMRKLGARLGVAAKTIYNYYSDKDELYLMLLIKGFEGLTARCRAVLEGADTGPERMKKLMQAYVHWGIENSHYYDIMFSMGIPKYSDYVGTPLEELASRQNETALQLAGIARTALTDLPVAKAPPEDITDLLRLWATAHGIVSLHNSRVTLEVADVRNFVNSLIEDTVATWVGDGRA